MLSRGCADSTGFHAIDTATDPVSFTIYTGLWYWGIWDDITYTAESQPGTELGVAQQVNLAQPDAQTVIVSFPDLATDEYVDVSEVCEPLVVHDLVLFVLSSWCPKHK